MRILPGLNEARRLMATASVLSLMVLSPGRGLAQVAPLSKTPFVASPTVLSPVQQKPRLGGATSGPQALTSVTPQTVTGPSLPIFSPPNLAATATEIVELARSLKNDPSLIFQFVHDNIEFSATYGGVKGPLGTLLDRRGGAFDQSALLVALLQQASLNNPNISNISYQVGTLSLTGTQLASWLDSDSDYLSIFNVFVNSGGYPQSAIGALYTSDGTHVSSATVQHVWVQATISGQTVVYDPAFKQHNQNPGVGFANLGALFGYRQGDLTTAAGGTVGAGPPSFSGASRAGIRNQLAAYTTTLANYLKANFAGKGLADLVGGQTIIPADLTKLGAANPNLASGSSTTSLTPAQWAADTTKHATFSVQLPGWSQPVAYFGDTVYGHRLTVVFSAAGAPTLYLDGVAQGPGVSGAVQAGSVQSGTNLYPISVGYALPWRTDLNISAFCGGVTDANGQCSKGVVPNSTYLISSGFDQVGRGMIEKHRELLAKNSANGASTSSEPVLGETLAVIGYSWLAENAARQQLGDQILGIKTGYFYGIGIAGQAVGPTTQGPYVDLPWNFVAPSPRLNASTAAAGAFTAAFFDLTKISSGFEAGVLRQIDGQQVANFTAASTTFLLDNALVNSDTIYSFTNSNFDKTKLIGYGAGDINSIQSYLALGYTITLPAHGNITVGPAWSGTGYEAALLNSTSGSIAEIISGSQHGGFAALNTTTTNSLAGNVGSQQQGGITATNAPAANTVNGAATTPTSTYTRVASTVGDPVERQTGAYIYSHDDLVTGSQAFPYGLGFQRSYTSSAAGLNSPIGYGWTHNYLYSALPNSDGFDSLGASSPAAAAAAIVAIYAANDLMTTAVSTNPIGLKFQVIDTVVDQWMIDQLVLNVAAITQPTGVEHFVKLPDGTYAAPLGSANTYVANADGTSTYKTPDQVALNFDATGKLTTWHSPAGPTVTFGYTGSNLTSVNNGMGRQLTLGYNGSALASVSDGARTVSYTPDAKGNLGTFTDALGGKTNFVYDVNGTYDFAASHLTQVFYPGSYGGAAGATPIVTNTYDSLGHVKVQADANNHVSTYYTAGNRTEFVDPDGVSKTWYLDDRGHLLQIVSGCSAGGSCVFGGPGITSYTLDDAGRTTKTTTPSGRMLQVTYDAWNNVTNLIDTPPAGSQDPHPPGTAALAARQRCFAYDPTFHKLMVETDYTASCSVASGVITGGNQTSYVINPTTGTVTSQATPAVAVDDTTVSASGTIAYPRSPVTASLVTSWTYDPRGLVLTRTDPGLTAATRMITQYTYDTATSNLLSLVSDLSGYAHKTSYGYDAAGNVNSVTDPNGNTTTSQYDALRLLKTVTPPPNNSSPVSTVTFTYDGLGNQLSVTRTPPGGGAAQVSSATYTPTSKVLRTVDPSGATVSYGYDAADRLLTSTDGTGRTKVYYYDPAGHLNYIGDGAGKTIEYRIYDADDRMFRQDDGDGHCTTFSFDGFDRKSGITYYGGSCYTGGPSGETFGYTINDGLDYDQTRAGNVITATYDVLGRLATRSTGPEISYPSTAAFNYNAGSQISRVSRGGDRADWDNGPFSRQWLSLYRTDGLKAEDIFPDYKALKYEYDANGNRTALDWADGHNALATNSSGAYLLGGEPVQYRAASFYDKVNRLTQIQYGDNVHSLVGSVQLSGLDAFGREQVRYLGGNVDFDNAICWTYDKSGTGTNLTALRHVVGGTNYCGAATTALENDYTYDAAHRVLTQSTIGLTIARPPAAASLAYGAPTGTNAIPTVAAAALSYDLDGNLYSAPYAGSAYGGNSGDAPVAKPDRYNFDYQGRLVTAYAGADIYNYAYDPFGRRTTKIKNAVIATLTLQDDRGDDVGDYDSAGNPVTRYIHNGREVAPVAAVSAADGSFRFNRFDRLGSVVAVTQGTGTAATVVAQTAYLPYGAPAGGSVIGSAFGYAGYRYDTETGLYHTASRYYDPRLGRFLTPDPIGYAGGINYYAYVGNDPVNLTDPSGECVTCLIGGVANVAIGYGISYLTGSDYTFRNAAVDFGVGFVTSGVAALNAARRGAQIYEGVYAVRTVAGETYVGQSGNIPGRLAQHVDNGFITQQAADNASLYQVLGGKTSREVAEQAMIDSYGGIGNLANKVNPIGGRMSLLSDQTLGNTSSDNLIRYGQVGAANLGIDSLTNPGSVNGAGGQPSLK